MQRRRDNGNQQKLPEYLTYKYSDNKRCSLHESIILSGVPVFIKYIDGETIVVGAIEENSRIIRPPRKEEYPYEPYEFVSLDEIETYVHRIKTETFDSLYFTARSIVEKFNDQDEVIIIALAIDIIWSYYQDLFATTHYDNITGDNETGKSSIGYTFEFTGYRPVKGTSISTANYYRMLGTIEPGQCIFIEDEADNIEEDHDKMKILKS